MFRRHYEDAFYYVFEAKKYVKDQAKAKEYCKIFFTKIIGIREEFYDANKQIFFALIFTNRVRTAFKESIDNFVLVMIDIFGTRQTSQNKKQFFQN